MQLGRKNAKCQYPDTGSLPEIRVRGEFPSKDVGETDKLGPLGSVSPQYLLASCLA